MKWQGRRRSSNVNDARGRGVSGGRKVAVGGGVGLVIALVVFLLTGNPGTLLRGIGTQDATVPSGNQQVEYQVTQHEQQLYDYASVVLADIEDTWNTILPQEGADYIEPELTIYSGMVQSGCGLADSGVGPFYCPADQSIYLDLSFYDTLLNRFGARQGDFGMAYVIAHEAGHHVQTLMGVTGQLDRLRTQVTDGRLTQEAYNQYSVRFELQADYLAGVVARYMAGRGYLDPGDLEEALSAAASVGDDHIQRQAQGYVNPDTFNHGTSAQRQHWFMTGYEAGDLSQWDTLSALI
ncbi:MAG: zinc metallopeptidase [Eubacteriales bacterium]|nr:zinc metallopeptidase [Eubacteriales bacterium]